MCVQTEVDLRRVVKAYDRVHVESLSCVCCSLLVGKGKWQKMLEKLWQRLECQKTNPLILQSHILSNKAILRLVNESRTNYIQIINIVYRLLKCGDYKLTT